jgi:hypothetical protein
MIIKYNFLYDKKITIFIKYMPTESVHEEGFICNQHQSINCSFQIQNTRNINKVLKKI